MKEIETGKPLDNSLANSDEEHGIWYSDESLKQIVQNKYNIK